MSPLELAVAAGSTTELDAWLERVEKRTARIGVIGMGYVGLPLALLLSEERFRVTGFDIDAEKVTQLNRGESYIRHIEGDHLAMAHQAGFRATTDYAEIAAMDAVLICVPTPLHADHTPDMRAVVHTIESIAPHLLPGQLVILESTTYPGTTEELIVPAINRAGQARGVQVLAPLPASAGVDDARLLDGVMVAFSPEREDPGNMVVPRREVPKVIGGYDARATAAACALYSCIFRSTVPVSSPATAEMTKLLENIYRCVNIALVNEIKLVCEGMGLDVWEVIDAASTKPFGFQPFYPGPGVGGHCIPVDPFYLSWKARQHGHATRFIELAGEVNESMPAHVVQTTSRALKQRGCSLMGARALILGLAYKADVDDLRESPALRIIDLLEQAGARVHYNDPYFPQVGRGRKYDLQMHSTPLSDLGKFDCVLIVTDHSVYNYEQIVDEAKLVIDTRNATRGRRSPKIVRC